MSAPRMNVDPDIGRARTLPGSFYSDSREFDLQRERIFARKGIQFSGIEYAVVILIPVNSNAAKGGVVAIHYAVRIDVGENGTIYDEGIDRCRVFDQKVQILDSGLDRVSESVEKLNGYAQHVVVQNLRRVIKVEWIDEIAILGIEPIFGNVPFTAIVLQVIGWRVGVVQ